MTAPLRHIFNHAGTLKAPIKGRGRDWKGLEMQRPGEMMVSVSGGGKTVLRIMRTYCSSTLPTGTADESSQLLLLLAAVLFITAGRKWAASFLKA